MKTLITAVLALSLAVSAVAQDWDADNAGFFFDTDAAQTSTVAAFGETVRAYLVAFNLTFDAAIESWQGGCYWPCVMGAGPWPDFANYQIFTITVPGNVTLAYEECGVAGQRPAGVILSPAAAPSVVLAYMDVVLLTMDPVGIYDEWGGVEVQLTDGTTRHLDNSTYPVSTMPPFLWLYATINSDITPIGNETSSWGELKTLFR